MREEAAEEKGATGVPGRVLSRQHVIDALSEHFAADHIEVEELERRLDLAHRAETPAELTKLLSDLPGGAEVVPYAAPAQPAPVPVSDSAPGGRLARPSEVRESATVVAIWGGATRKGSWVPARRINAVAVMGGLELDFREARFAPGVTTLKVFALMGGADVIVPPDVRVECDGIGIMGGFDFSPDPEAVPAPNAPVLRVQGLAFWGGAGVTVRRAGESAGDARRRRRIRRKEQKRLAREERKRLGP